MQLWSIGPDNSFRYCHTRPEIESLEEMQEPTGPLFPEELQLQLEQGGVLAVLTIEDPADAVPVAEALLRGGVNVMELAWRTPRTLDCLRAIKAGVPDMVAGIGTVLQVEQLEQVAAEGADFAVSPGLSTKLLSAARSLEFPYAPGVATPTDVQIALEFGARFLKFFPAEPQGGLPFLRSMQAPFAHLGVRFIILGGLKEDNAAAYLEEPSVSVLGGSWLAPPALIKEGNWDEIEARARRIVAIIAAAKAEA